MATIRTNKMRINKHHLLDFKQKLFSATPLSNECWDSLESLIEVKELSKTEYFSKSGQRNREFSYVISGIGRIYFLTNKGEEYTKHFIQNGDFLMATVEPNVPSEVNIQALTDMTYLSVPFRRFEELLNEYHELMNAYNKLIFSYFGKKQKREINLLSKNATQNYKDFVIDFPNFEKKIAHYHIASYLGITPTQLSRIRKNTAHQHL